MTTTSLKLPARVKARVNAAAKRKGVSPHAFMVDAIALVTRAADDRSRFIAAAIDSYKTTKETGLAYAEEDVRAYILARTKGKTLPRPKLKPWRA